MSKKKYRSLSDGVTDGIVLFYMKDKMLHPVLITEEQAELLDLSLLVPFKENPLKVNSTPIEYETIKKMIIK